MRKTAFQSRPQGRRADRNAPARVVLALGALAAVATLPTAVAPALAADPATALSPAKAAESPDIVAATTVTRRGRSATTDRSPT